MKTSKYIMNEHDDNTVSITKKGPTGGPQFESMAGLNGPPGIYVENPSGTHINFIPGITAKHLSVY